MLMNIPLLEDPGSDNGNQHVTNTGHEAEERQRKKRLHHFDHRGNRGASQSYLPVCSFFGSGMRRLPCTLLQGKRPLTCRFGTAQKKIVAHFVHSTAILQVPTC